MPAVKFTALQETPEHWQNRAVKDLVSGFEGYCLGRFEYANGCVRVEIAGVDKDNKPTEFVFDQQSLAWADKWIDGFEPPKQMTAGLPLAKKKVGGPRTAPTPPRDPGRRGE